jgi:hypothetical protein
MSMYRGNEHKQVLVLILVMAMYVEESDWNELNRHLNNQQ